MLEPLGFEGKQVSPLPHSPAVELVWHARASVAQLGVGSVWAGFGVQGPALNVDVARTLVLTQMAGRLKHSPSFTVQICPVTGVVHTPLP